MATKKPANKGTGIVQRPDKVRDSIVLQSNSRAKKDIQQWRTALNAAENVENPKRLLLYNLYEEIILDAHLSAEIEKRKTAVKGAKFNLLDVNGVVDVEASKFFQTTWFDQFVDYVMDSIFWGHSLMEITALTEDGLIQSIGLVPRRHVIPEKGIFTVKQGDEKGINYREDMKYVPWVIEVGDSRNLGLLNKCVPHALYKRFSQSAWAEFCQIFGMPVRYGKTNTRDTESLNRLNDMLIQMATASHAVIDTDEELHFIETAKSNGDVFQGLLNVCNAEISKLINGSVIGEASKEGSKAKEQVGLELQNRTTLGDKRMIESAVKDILLPKMIALGYPVADRTPEYETVKDIQGEWTIFNGLLTHYDIDPEDIKDTFGINVKPKTQPAPGRNQLHGNGFFG